MRTILTVLTCLFSFVCFAQKNFKRGYVVTNNSDTLWGYINYVDHNNNPSTIIFKKKMEVSDSKKYNLQDIQYFEIEGYEYYTRWVCKISMDPVKVNLVTSEIDSTSRTDSIFLRSIAAGKHVQLYSYEDDVKIRYYIKGSRDSIPKELIYKAYLDNEYAYILREQNTFQVQLLKYASEFNIPANFGAKVEKSSYSKSDLLRLVNIINGESVKNFEEANKYRKTRIYFQGGLAISHLRFVGLKSAESFKFSPSYAPVIGLGIDVFGNPAIGKLLFRQEIMLSSTSFKGTQDLSNSYYSLIFHYKLKRNSLTYNSSILYNIYNTESFKVFMGGGVAANFAGYPENKYYRKDEATGIIHKGEPYKLNSFSMDGIVRSGVIFKNKIEASVIASFPISNTSNHQNVRDKQKSQQIRIGYLFTNKKRSSS